METDSTSEKKNSFLKIFGSIGTIIGLVLGLNSLYKLYDEKTIANVSGKWEVELCIENTSFKPYKGLKLKYCVFMVQQGSQLTGHGDKIAENEAILPTVAKTPISLNGTIDGNKVQITYEEIGKKRKSQGMMNLTLNEDSGLEGLFSTTAANSSGKCSIEISN